MSAIGSRNKKGYPTNDDIWTPKYIFDALNVDFDLDVCSSELKTYVPSKQKYTEKMNGLIQPWKGRIWMNPPYSKTSPWVDRFLEHKNGLCLVQVSKGKWFLKLWCHPEVAMVLMPHNFKFAKPDGQMHEIFMPVALCAIGNENIQALKDSKLGYVRK